MEYPSPQDPKKVTWEGEKVAYRLLYSQWLTDCVKKVDPKASDELLLLARGGCQGLGSTAGVCGGCTGVKVMCV